MNTKPIADLMDSAIDKLNGLKTPTKMKKTNEQLLADAREELIKATPYEEWAKNSYPYEDGAFRTKKWKEIIDKQAAELALKRKDEEHEREMEGLIQLLKEVADDIADGEYPSGKFEEISLAIMQIEDPNTRKYLRKEAEDEES